MPADMAANAPTHGLSELGRQIDTAIQIGGPMSLAAYMQLCLTHPKAGYYIKGDPLGGAGDFITAPEISQMFGEMIGVWLAVTIEQLGASQIELVELGPGRGTLLRDALKALARTGNQTQIELTLVEASPVFTDLQRQALAGHKARWVREIDDICLKGAPLIILANEFFDALPIKQYQMADGAWHERVVGLRDQARAMGLDPNPVPVESLPEAVRAAQEGEIFEYNQLAIDLMEDLAQRLVERGGAMLTIDYGYEKTQTGDTFQAVKAHNSVDPLATPGQADLTAHVDFESLRRAAQEGGARVHPLLTQSAFLEQMGIGERAKVLARANPQRAEAIKADLDRLTSPKAMGTLFKVLCLSHQDLVPYPFASEPGKRPGEETGKETGQ